MKIVQPGGGMRSSECHSNYLLNTISVHNFPVSDGRVRVIFEVLFNTQYVHLLFQYTSGDVEQNCP